MIKLIRRFKNAIIIFLIGIVIGIVGIFIINNYMASTKQTEVSSNVTDLGFKDIGELATESAYTTNVNVIDKNMKLFNLIDIPFTQSKYIYSYDCVVKAGYDFGDIEWTIDENKKQITITLPKVKLLSNEVDEDSLQVYYEKDSMFTVITLEDNNEALKELKKNAKEKAIANGLYDNAKKNAKKLLESFIGETYDLNEYSLDYNETE